MATHQVLRSDWRRSGNVFLDEQLEELPAPFRHFCKHGTPRLTACGRCMHSIQYANGMHQMKHAYACIVA